MAALALIAWVVWVGTTSNGFDQIKPMGWLVFAAAPAVAYLLLLVVLPLVRGTLKDVRLLLSATVMWSFLLAAWGYIWDWESHLASERYIALFVLPPTGLCLGLLLWRWSKAGYVGEHSDPPHKLTMPERGGTNRVQDVDSVDLNSVSDGVAALFRRRGKNRNGQN
ncbi:hypothetical protein GCM10028813_38470 [Ramlibacter alkalitolerans]